MRRIVAGLFLSLDGVVEAPERWNPPYFNDEEGAAIGATMAESDAMLLLNIPLDELRLMVHPVVVGSGRRLFEGDGDQKALKLVDSKTFSTGVVSLTYVPASA